MSAFEYSRRAFIRQVAGGAMITASGLPLLAKPHLGSIPPKQIISGTARDRGRAYGRAFKDGIAGFLDKEIYASFIKKPAPKDEMLRYAAACGKVIKEVCRVVHDELEGAAEGSGLSFEELVLVTLHEELYHRGVLPKVNHCTAVAIGPPDAPGGTLVGQTWDWMESVYGLSSVIEWRTGGVNVLAYGFPGLWAGAGLSSSGFALCWTSASLGNHALGARVGLPSYALIAHLLYQPSLKEAIAEAKRDRHAGWFAFVVGDKDGTLVSIEGSPKSIQIDKSHGRLFRVGYASREMTGTPAGKPVPINSRCKKMDEHVEAAGQKMDVAKLQRSFADPSCGISVGKGTIDMMVFDCAAGKAYLSRGPSYGMDWKEFAFGDHK